MTKEESKVIKGVAILFMLYLHLFNHLDQAMHCYNFIFISETPFSHILTRATGPVSFFLILSGYGLYIVENKKKNYNIVKKIRNLYVHYWISLMFFVPLGAFMVGTSVYPGSIEKIISNVTAWNTNSWNGEIWFLFPYMLLALSSKWLFHLLDKMNSWLFMGIALFLSLSAGFCISRYGSSYLYSHWLPYMPILYCDCLFAFAAGAWMAKFNIIAKCKEEGIKVCKGMTFKMQGMQCWFLLICLIAFRCCFRTGAFHTFYAIVFIVLFVNAPRPIYLDAFLSEMGKRSTSMWFVHTYFCYYIFHDFIYGFKYPVLIFISLLICSYISAIVIDFINSKIQAEF